MSLSNTVSLISQLSKNFKLRKLNNKISNSKAFKIVRNIRFVSNLIGLNNSRFILKFLVILLTLFILWPLFSLIEEGLYGVQKGSVYLTIDKKNIRHFKVHLEYDGPIKTPIQKDQKIANLIVSKNDEVIKT